jgi:hypothetical protein
MFLRFMRRAKASIWLSISVGIWTAIKTLIKV